MKGARVCPVPPVLSHAQMARDGGTARRPLADAYVHELMMCHYMWVQKYQQLAVYSRQQGNQNSPHGSTLVHKASV